MKKIKPITLKSANLLSDEEMKHICGGSSASSASSVCGTYEGKPCRLMVKISSSTGWLPYQGVCKPLRNGGWVRCACVAGDYNSDPSKPSSAYHGF